MINKNPCLIARKSVRVTTSPKNTIALADKVGFQRRLEFERYIKRLILSLVGPKDPTGAMRFILVYFILARNTKALDSLTILLANWIIGIHCSCINVVSVCNRLTFKKIALVEYVDRCWLVIRRYNETVKIIFNGNFYSKSISILYVQHSANFGLWLLTFILRD